LSPGHDGRPTLQCGSTTESTSVSFRLDESIAFRRASRNLSYVTEGRGDEGRASDALIPRVARPGQAAPADARSMQARR